MVRIVTTETNEKTYKAEEVLEKLNHWYKILAFYTDNTYMEKDLRTDMSYIRDAVIAMNGDKQADHLRFAKMFKKLFAKQNKELAQENLELKRELAEKKMEERIKEIKEKKDE